MLAEVLRFYAIFFLHIYVHMFLNPENSNIEKDTEKWGGEESSAKNAIFLRAT